MQKRLTVAQVAQAGELFGGQVDNSCRKHSVLIAKSKDGCRSLLFGSIVAMVVAMVAGIFDYKVVASKAQLGSNSSIGKSCQWVAMGGCCYVISHIPLLQDEEAALRAACGLAVSTVGAHMDEHGHVDIEPDGQPPNMLD
jgi:hypothetical protein